MKWLGKLIGASTLLASGAALLLLPQLQAWPQDMSGMHHGAPHPDEPVPAYHPQAPTDTLPPTMDPAQFAAIGVANAYTAAGRVRKILYQQPCFCHCDRSQGHGSLLDCFVSRHGSGCEICMREDFYTYEQTRKGKTPAQIRDGILRGEWQDVDLGKYASTRWSAPSPAK